MAIPLLNSILKEFLFTGSKPETKFIACFLEKKPLGEPAGPEKRQSGWLAKVAELLSLYQAQPEDGTEAEEAVPPPGGPEIDRDAFEKVYASLKGLHLFWLDFAVFDMLRHTDRPNAFRDETDKFIRVYNEKHRSRRAMMARIVGQYRHYAGHFLAGAGPHGALEAGAEMETAAFYEAMAREGLDPANSRLSRDEAREYLADRHEYLLMWLRPLESRIKGGTVTTKRRRR
jgi:hypothetical protein